MQTACPIDAETVRNALALIAASTDERVCFVGETIRDEYRYVGPLGKPPKENMLAVQAQGMEAWAGGVVAAAAHAREFCRVEVVTPFLAVTKTRFVDRDSGRKLLEVQTLPGLERLKTPALDGYGTTAVCDFGHGLIDAFAARGLAERPGFLAVCAQTNAANAGYNLITKYPSASYVVIDEPEARLAAADRDSPIEDLMRRLAAGCYDTLVVTHGRHGAYGLSDACTARPKFLHMPALSDRVVDTMGAGDAFFAVTACLARRAHEFGGLRTLLAIGCAAGAVKCGIMGHRQAVTKDAVVELLRAHL